jgi:hypothetical protein
MDFEAWMLFFGTSQDDPQLKVAMAAAGVKRVPKLDDEETSVQFELKGHGLELVMTDEATLKKLEDQDVGEGPLIMSGVVAKLGKSHGRDSYVGKLPFGVAADMSQDAVRKLLGKPTSTGERHPVDIWTRKEHEIVARYSKDCQSLTTLSVTLPGVEF